MSSELPPGATSEEGARSQVPHAIRPGDVLADRYLLVDLLSESGNGRFWRAHDRILDRRVAVHVVAANDDHADAMMTAARSSAAVPDRRILRVLDVDRRDDLCYVVNEWGSGTSLDILVAREGPVTGRRAAWIVSEVAASIATAHEAGAAHGRLIPENVLIDESGSVRVIGFSVDAALLGLPPGRMSSDVTDLAGLLYFSLTGKWPGVSRSAVPAAPQEGGRVLRPRQVKAGIPRTLDALCDQVINPYSTGGADSPAADLLSARGIRDALREFVGDPSGMAAAEVVARRNGSSGSETRSLPVFDPPTGSGGATADAAEAADERSTGAVASGEEKPAAADVPERGAEEPPAPAADRTPTPAPGPRPAAEQPTQAGMPVFDDDGDDVSWFTARAEKPPPPPAFEPPPERPLFAPAPEDGGPVRKPRPHSRTRSTGGQDYWPWESGTGAGTGSGVIPVTEDEGDKDDEVPGRNWLRLAAAVGASTLLLIAVVFAFNLGRGRSPLGEVQPEDTPSPTRAGSPSATAAAPLTGVTAGDFDPQGDPPEENSDLAPLAVDGDAATAWRTVTYEQDLGPGGLKTGVGLVLDLGGSTGVTAVDLTLAGAPTTVSVFVTDKVPTGVSGLTASGTATVEGTRTRVPFDEPASGRFVVVWLTSLPEVEGGFRGEVAEVTVRG